MSTTGTEDMQISHFIRNAIEGVAKKQVEDLIEKSVAEFRIKCEEKRAEMLVNVIAHIFEHMQTMDKEIIIRIPISPKL